VNIDIILNRLRRKPRNEAIAFKDQGYSNAEILDLVEQWQVFLRDKSIGSGSVLSIISDYSPDSIALVIASLLNGNIVVPLCPAEGRSLEEYLHGARVRHVIRLADSAVVSRRKTTDPAQNNLLKNLVENHRPGLILFTSGSSGGAKAVVHDFEKFLSRYKRAGKALRTLCFMMFDHMAGIDTYFYCLFSGSTAVLPTSRSPSGVCRLIEEQRIEVLPCSPTFMNLMLISGEYRKYDLSSLKIIVLGSERITPNLLDRVTRAFDDVAVIQKYGITELGVPPSKTNCRDPSLIKFDQNHFESRITDGILHVKARGAMLGYLDAPFSMSGDAWFNTGDLAEAEGDYIRILGRESSIVNVGGEKVNPTDVENVLMQVANVAEVEVYGEKNALVGEVVCARVRLVEQDDHRSLITSIKRACAEKLESHKRPVKINITKNNLHCSRFKKSVR